MDCVEKLCETVSGWPRTTAHPHRFSATEFRFGKAEIGHVHRGGIVDIPFPRAIRDLLVANHLAGEHHWVPDSGWITFAMRDEGELEHAVWLMRLSYLRYALKSAPDAREMLEKESAELELSSEFKRLLEGLIPSGGTANQAKSMVEDPAGLSEPRASA